MKQKLNSPSDTDPHLGHLHSMVMADVFHRYHELVHHRPGLLGTGTDEHGLKIQKVAEAAEESPLALCDRVSQTFKVRQSVGLNKSTKRRRHFKT